MKKGKLINKRISTLIAGLGHSDEVVIADAGLPIPIGPKRIDLALTNGVPTFVETLEVILEEMFIEKAYVSKEIAEFSPHILDLIREKCGDIEVEKIPHQEFKNRTKSALGIIRTGEFTPYANVILVSGAWGFEKKNLLS